MKILNWMGITLSLVVTSGCGNFNSIHRPINVSSGFGALIDIKQRAILVGDRTEDGVITKVVCAEPSPDAMAAYAAEVAAKSEKAQIQLAASFQESAAFTGLRTSAIQLLRDQLFANCLSYMNGASTRPQSDLLMRRFQKHTVALLAIEQLTGVVKAPAISINTSGSAEAARSVSELSSQITRIDSEIADLKSKETAASEEEKPAVTAALKALAEKKDLLSGAVKQARDLIASGSASALVSATGVQTSRSDAHLESVATTIKEIVNNIILADDTPQLCLLRLADASAKPDALHSICVQYFARVEATYKLKLQAAELQLISEKSAPATTKDQKAQQSKRLADIIGGLDGPGAAAALSIKPKLESK